MIVSKRIVSKSGRYWRIWLAEILYLIRGQFSAIVQATEYRLNEGDLIIINSGDLHMTRSNTCTYLLLQISASQMRRKNKSGRILQLKTDVQQIGFVLMSPLSSLFRVTSSSFLVLSLVDIDISPNFWYNILIFFDYN